MRITPLLIVATLLFAGCVSEEEPTFEWTYEPEPINENDESIGAPQAPIPETPPAEAGESVRFLIIGDQGSGTADQFAVADTMRAVCASKGCDFVMTTGDNIYDVGGFTEYDPQFIDKFEAPYEGMVNQSGEDLPFYLSLGNHDNFFGGFSQLVGESQVSYHYRTDRPSEMWNMPDRYYSQKFGNALEIFAVDTDSLHFNDPTITSVTPEIHQQWVREALDASDATWKIAFGHYNYVSNGNYGDGDADFKTAVEASICDRAHFYAQGHDHDLQWIKPTDSCGRTEVIGSSAASKARGMDDDFEFEARFGSGDVLGFAWVEIIGETFHLEFIDLDQTILFEETVTKAELGW